MYKVELVRKVKVIILQCGKELVREKLELNNSCKIGLHGFRKWEEIIQKL